MTIDRAATDFALAITHDLCDDQSCVRSTICPRFQNSSVVARSQPGRVTGVESN